MDDTGHVTYGGHGGARSRTYSLAGIPDMVVNLVRTSADVTALAALMEQGAGRQSTDQALERLSAVVRALHYVAIQDATPSGPPRASAQDRHRAMNDAVSVACTCQALHWLSRQLYGVEWSRRAKAGPSDLTTNRQELAGLARLLAFDLENRWMQRDLTHAPYEVRVEAGQQVLRLDAARASADSRPLVVVLTAPTSAASDDHPVVVEAESAVLALAEGIARRRIGQTAVADVMTAFQAGATATEVLTKLLRNVVSVARDLAIQETSGATLSTAALRSIADATIQAQAAGVAVSLAIRLEGKAVQRLAACVASSSPDVGPAIE